MAIACALPPARSRPAAGPKIALQVTTMRRMLHRLPLRLLLTLPYVLLLVALAAAVGWLSYRAADESLEVMANKLHQSTGERIQEATGAYLSNWQYVLAAAQGDDLSLPIAERRLWSAGALSSVRPSYVFFAATDGRFVGVQRGRDSTELRLRTDPGRQAREIFRLAAPGDRSLRLGTEPVAFDATTRPWYRAATAAAGDVWSPVYRDFSTQAPTVTLARARRDDRSQLLGVYGADVPLAQIGDFLKRLAIVQHGLAYVVTRDGLIVASSISDTHASALQPASASADDTLVASYHAIAARLQAGRSAVASGPAGVVSRYNTREGTILVSASPLRAHASLDWWVVVVLREDLLMAGITRTAWHAAGLTTLAALLVLALGWLVLRSLLGEVRKLTLAAELLGAEQSPMPLRTQRHDELGRLSDAFDRMVGRLNLSTSTVLSQHEELTRTVAELGAEARARDAIQQRFRSITDAMNEAFVVINSDWTMSYANPLAVTFGARPLSELAGLTLWQAYPTLIGSELEAALRQAAASGTPQALEAYSQEVGRWLEVRLFPSPLGMAVFFSDVSQRRLQRQALADRQRQLQLLAGQLLTTQSEERRSIARELHDEMGQQLAALRINLQVLRSGTPEGPEGSRLDDSLAIVQQVIAQVRSRALDLHPAILDDLGLAAALRWLCQRQQQRSGVVVQLQELTTLPVLPPSIGLAGYRIAQEAIGNALKHAAPRRIDLRLGHDDVELQLDIADDGSGFDATTAALGQSLGLVGMRERAEQLGGTLNVMSGHNRGTLLQVRIPLS